ncbi:hypothetical protein CYMTET_23639 [Cymbomonas tetramitiformis]|uniref:Prolyl 4-hydroxylase alpha subunit domain-containing protein n=1 Tax=Cymbomonas tetramitiformis TaxID=36881 RepID=A0AAE0L0X1_9CHLO|nr:hypothetical protein CYMTET_23639 [Cymbomonas tetramitiformis]
MAEKAASDPGGRIFRPRLQEWLTAGCGSHSGLWGAFLLDGGASRDTDSTVKDRAVRSDRTRVAQEKKPLGEVFHQLTRKIVRTGSTTLRVQAGDRKAPGSLEETAWAGTDQLCRDQTLSIDVPQTSYQQRGKGTFAIKPKRGSAVVFYSRKLDGDLDTQMWHAGCTVVQGTKWIAQKFKGFTS